MLEQGLGHVIERGVLAQVLTIRRMESTHSRSLCGSEREREVSLVDCNVESLFLALVPMPLVDLALAKP